MFRARVTSCMKLASQNQNLRMTKSSALIYVRMLLLILAALCLGACAGLIRPDGRLLARQMAENKGFTPLRLETGSYVLMGWLRPGSGPVLHVYIEGDGLSWINRSTPSSDPTPTNMSAFGMAAADPATGPVLYLARPGQYVEGADRRNTGLTDWTDARYSEAVLKSLMEAVRKVEAMSGTTRLALYGYSGGGTLAALLAEQRVEDVVFLGTAAGNLDPEGWVRHHGVSPLLGSLSPRTHMSRLRAIPQFHAAGNKDKVVPFIFAEAWCKDLAGLRCRAVPVPGLDHYSGWPEAWAHLLMENRPEAVLQ